LNNIKPYRAAKQLGANTKKKSNTLPLNHIMLALVLALPTLASTSLSAQPVEAAASAKQTQHYKIAAGPLNKVLAKFAKTSGILIAGSNKLAQGKTSQGIKGKYTIEQALSRLLTDTGLQAVKQVDGSYRIESASGKVMTLATAVVQSDDLKDGSSEDGYRTDEITAVGPWQGRTLQETPYSINVVSEIYKTPPLLNKYTRHPLYW
jgi:hypothetical protein